MLLRICRRFFVSFTCELCFPEYNIAAFPITSLVYPTNAVFCFRFVPCFALWTSLIGYRCVLFVQLHIPLVNAVTCSEFRSKISSPDGNCLITDLSKWPLQPGVLVHVNKMNGISISQLSPRISPFKTTSVSRTKTYLKYKRNKSKIYARLERLKELLGINSSPHHVPIGIKEGEAGGKMLLT